jgi:SOS-response transcriptional repressor LexA
VHPIQAKLLDLSRHANLAKLSLREIGRQIGIPGEAPQRIKHHLTQLEKKGFLNIDRTRGVMGRSPPAPSWAEGLFNSSHQLFSIPVLGTANCGPGKFYAEENFQGFLRVSSRLLGRKQPTRLYAIRTSGSSMNRAEVGGKCIEDGDYVIVDARPHKPTHGEIVVAIVDNRATIKRFYADPSNKQVVLRAESSHDYDPIFLHEDDDFNLSGRVIAVIKRPSAE